MPWTSPWVCSRAVAGLVAAVVAEGLGDGLEAAGRLREGRLVRGDELFGGGAVGGRHEHRGEDHDEHEDQPPRDAGAPGAHGAQPSQAPAGGAAEAVPAHGGLDEAVAEVGDDERHDDAPGAGGEVRRPAGRDRQVGPDDEEDRPVPEVDAVAAGADPAGGRKLEHGLEAAGPFDDDENEHGRRERGQQDAAAEGPRGGLTGAQEEDEQGGQRCRGHVAAVGSPPRRAGPRAVRRGPRERQRGAEHQPHDVGVGAVVGAGGALGVDPDGHERRPRAPRGRGPPPHGPRTRGRGAAGAAPRPATGGRTAPRPRGTTGS